MSKTVTVANLKIIPGGEIKALGQLCAMIASRSQAFVAGFEQAQQAMVRNEIRKQMAAAKKPKKKKKKSY